MYFPKGKNQKPFHSDLVELTGFYDYILHLPNQKIETTIWPSLGFPSVVAFRFTSFLGTWRKTYTFHWPHEFCQGIALQTEVGSSWEFHWWVCLYSHIHPVWDIFSWMFLMFFKPMKFCFSITLVLLRIGLHLSDGKYLKVVPRFQITTLNQWTMITRRPQTTFKVRLTVPWVYQSHGHKILQELATQSSHDKAWSFRLETRLRSRGGWWFGVLPCPTRTFSETSRLATTSLHFHGCQR